MMLPHPRRCVHPQGITLVAWAFAALNVNNPELMSQIANRMMQPGFLATMKAQDIAMTSWAYANLGIKYPQLMDSLASRVVQDGMAATFSAEELAMAVAGFAESWKPWHQEAVSDVQGQGGMGAEND